MNSIDNYSGHNIFWLGQLYINGQDYVGSIQQAPQPSILRYINIDSLNHTFYWFGQDVNIDLNEKSGGNPTVIFQPGNSKRTWSLPAHNDTWIITLHSI